MLTFQGNILKNVLVDLLNVWLQSYQSDPSRPHINLGICLLVKESGESQNLVTLFTILLKQKLRGSMVNIPQLSSDQRWKDGGCFFFLPLMFALVVKVRTTD